MEDGEFQVREYGSRGSETSFVTVPNLARDDAEHGP
jgi:hypothetical protein